VALGKRQWFVFKRSCQGIVPAIEKPECRNDRDNFDDLLLAPVSAQFREHLVGDRVRHASCRDRYIEDGAFGRAEEWTRLIFPHSFELPFVEPELHGRVRGMRHAVLASRRAARHVGNETLQPRIDLSVRIPDRRTELRECMRDFLDCAA